MSNLRSLLTAILALGGAVASAIVSIAVALRLIRRAEPGQIPPAPPAPAPPAPSPTPATDGGEPPPLPPGEPPAPALVPPVLPGWHAVTEPLPDPTYWPAVLALGVVFLAWGLITGYLLSIVGLMLSILAVAGWIGDLRHEQREHEG